MAKFDSFPQLPEALQKEALREGETLLNAQLTIATAADQRTLPAHEVRRIAIIAHA